MNKTWVVLEFDEEENTPSDSIVGVYGPFASEVVAKTWAGDKWCELPEEQQEFRAFSAEPLLAVGESEEPVREDYVNKDGRLGSRERW